MSSRVPRLQVHNGGSGPNPNGEKVVKRLTEQHGFNFVFDANCHAVYSDLAQARFNYLEGNDAPTWTLYDQFGIAHFYREINGENHPIKKVICGVTSATKLLRSKAKWDIVEDDSCILIRLGE